MQRQSNNFRPQFTDEECITVYLWGISQRRFEQKAIYNYTRNHLLEWFPNLPSYQAFSHRLNMLAPAFQALAEVWLGMLSGAHSDNRIFIVDSCPIILARGPRSSHAKVAAELCEKSYNSSRDEWYYGMKLHAFVLKRTGCLPLPQTMVVSGAAMHDLTAGKQIMENSAPIMHGDLYADKAYIDADWNESLKKEYMISIHTPRKARKNDTLKAGDAISTFVSTIRQPIECFFNWLDRLTDIQSASLVRSTRGLLSHVFGRISAALYKLCFNS